MQLPFALIPIPLAGQSSSQTRVFEILKIKVNLIFPSCFLKLAFKHINLRELDLRLNNKLLFVLIYELLKFHEVFRVDFLSFFFILIFDLSVLNYPGMVYQTPFVVALKHFNLLFNGFHPIMFGSVLRLLVQDPDVVKKELLGLFGEPLLVVVLHFRSRDVLPFVLILRN